MKNTTILNSNYTHLTVVSWERGLKLVLAEKVIAIEFYGGLGVKSAGGEVFEVPKTVVLKKYVRLPDKLYRPTRRNIFLRDNYTCGYCLKQLNSEELSVDHILPKSRGGKESWANLVTACKECNGAKGDRTPEEARMLLWDW